MAQPATFGSPEEGRFDLAGDLSLTPMSNGGVFLNRPIVNTEPGKGREPQLFHAHGIVRIGREAVKYTVAATEACAPDRVTIIVNGLGGFKSSSRGWRDTNALLAEEVTVSFSPVRNSGFFRNIASPHQAQVNAISSIVEDAKTNPEVKKKLPLDSIDFDRLRPLGQSMGVFAATLFAEQHEAKTEAVTYIVPTALHGMGSFAHLKHVITNGKNILADDLLPLTRSPHVGESPAKGLLRILRHNRRPDTTLGEVFSCLFEDYTERVASLGAITCCIASRKDKLVPFSPRLEQAVDFFETVDMQHTDPQKDPVPLTLAIMALHKRAGLR